MSAPDSWASLSRPAPCFAITSLFAVTTASAGGEASPDVVERRFLAAHDLDDDVTVLRESDLRVIREQAIWQGHRPFAGDIADEDAAEDETDAHAVAEAVRFLQESPGDAAADNAEAEEDNAYFRTAAHLRRLRCRLYPLEGVVDLLDVSVR